MEISPLLPEGQKRIAKLRHLARMELKAFDKSINERSFFNSFFRFTSVPPLLGQPFDPKQLFCSPIWTLAYGEPTDTKALIELTS